MNSQWRAYLSHAEDTLPMPTTRRLPVEYDDTLMLPAVPLLRVKIEGYDAAALTELAREDNVTPDVLVARWIRLFSYARQLREAR